MPVRVLFSLCNTCHGVTFQLFAAGIRLDGGERYQHSEVLLHHCYLPQFLTGKNYGNAAEIHAFL